MDRHRLGGTVNELSDDEVMTAPPRELSDADVMKPEKMATFAERFDTSPLPDALMARFEDGFMAKKREGGLLQTLPQFGGMIATSEGRARLWDAVKQYPAEFAKGMLDLLEVPGEVAKGNIDLNSPEGIDKAIGVGALVAFGRPNRLPLTGQTSGMALRAGDQMARIERGPTGEIYEQPIGGIPKPEDFANAARSLADDAPRSAEQKLRQLWDEYGIHPSEAAHDAERDPTVKQSLLSDGTDLPERYGKPKEPSAPAPKSGEPPEPGSLNEAQRAVLDKISIGDREPAQKLSLKKIYTQAVDDLFPLKGVSEDAYQLARLTRGQFGKAQHFLEHGTFDFNTYKTTGPSLTDILAPVREDLDGLRAYLTSKRAVEIEASGRKSGIDLEAAQRVLTDGGEKYEAVAAKLTQYQTSVLKYLKDSGVLSQESFDAMRAANKDYIPFFRVMNRVEERGGPGRSFGPGNPIKALKGSERDVIDPLESIIKNTYAYISIAERNAVGIKIIDDLKGAQPLVEGAKAETVIKPVRTPPKNSIDAEIAAALEDSGIADPPPNLVEVTRAAAGLDEGNTIGAFRDGVKETASVTDPELLSAFRGLDFQSTSLLTRIFAVPAKMLRAGAVLTPEFMVKNLIRDFSTAFINSKGVFTPIDTAKGLTSVIRKDADFQNWLKSGGANSTLVALDRRYMQESIEKLSGETGLMSRAWNVVTHPLQGLRMLSELAENATRLGEFKKVVGGSQSKADIQAAGFASREITVDFSRIGASTRAYNMITAFANATIQGTDRLVRAFHDRPVATSLKVAGGITMPSVLLWFANHEDPRYKELPQWQKDLFWIVLTKDNIYRIPKPFEPGIIFGSGAERVLEATLGKNPEAFKHFRESVMSALAPSVLPTAMVPMVEQFANRSTFIDRTLIPARMEKHLPEYQYTPYTTELAKALGKIIASFPGVREESLQKDSALLGGTARALSSPILIENYVRAWTGGLGNYAVNIADASLRKAGVLPDPPKSASTLADIPFVKAFVVRYPTASAQSIQDFYDGHDRNKAYFDTWNARAKEGDAEAMARIKAAGGPAMFARLDDVRKTLNQHSQLIRDVFKDPGTKPEEKRQIIDQLYLSMLKVAQGGKAALREAEKGMSKPAD
jgi:hypothetical protein